MALSIAIMPARKQYIPVFDPDQIFLLPPSPRDWLPGNHLAWFILDVVKRLDLHAVEDVIQGKDPRGQRPFNPRMMVGLLLYAYCQGVRSSRVIARATYTDVAFRVVSGDCHPHFTRIADFRKDHRDALAGLFVQVLDIARKAGLVALTHVAVDGTKIQGNASKHKAMSYERMQQTRDRLRKEVEAILAEADATDQREDAEQGEGKDREDLPDEVGRREKRLAVIEKAMADLEAEAREARAAALREQAERAHEAAAAAEDDAERKRAQARAKTREEAADRLDPPDDKPLEGPAFTTSDGLPMNRPPVTPDGLPKPEAQRNFTDPESRIMEKGGAYLQGYNCQAAVDDKNQIIVAHAVTNQAPDAGNLVPMIALVKENCGEAPASASADNGYWNPEVEERCRELGTEVYVSLGRKKHGEAPPPVDDRPPPEDATARERMAARLNTEKGRATYRLRKSVVEPVHGQIKEARGFRRFLARGLAAVQQEWAFECLCHNLLKVFRAAEVPHPALA